MNKKELVEALSEKLDCTKKDAQSFVDEFVEITTKQLKKGNAVEVAGFGKFVLKKRAARTGVNPKTGAKIKIAAAKVPGFKAAKALKEAVK